MAVLLRSVIALLSVSLFACVSASNKYCTGDVFKKNGKFCCKKQDSHGTKSNACANGASYKQIYLNCRRLSKNFCCDKKNDRHDCATPAPTTPAPTTTPVPTPTTPAPTTTPMPTPTTPAPSASFRSSSTRYWAGDTHGTAVDQKGACGGANLDRVSEALARLTSTLGMRYYAVAIAQGMGEPYMCGADESVGKGSPSLTGNGYANVLHTYCGQCVEFTTADGVTVGGVVMDTCPTVDGNGLDNSEFCSKGGVANRHGFHNHLDIHGTDSDSVYDVIGDNPTGSIVSVACPSAVVNELTNLAAASDGSSTSPVCSWYYDTHSGSWQGAPGMHDFGCSECSGSRRLSSIMV